MLTIGVLALQGSFQEHLSSLSALPVRGRLVKTASELDSLDGIILPGGESTTMSKLMRQFNLLQPLARKITNGFPVWGTCAGMILLAKSIVGQAECHLDVMNISVKRNAFGGQLDSFSTNAALPAISNTPIPLVFIRAPYVDSLGADVKILATVNNKIVAVEQGNMLATAFHPELTPDLRFHNYFLEKVKKQHTFRAD